MAMSLADLLKIFTSGMPQKPDVPLKLQRDGGMTMRQGPLDGTEPLQLKLDRNMSPTNEMPTMPEWLKQYERERFKDRGPPGY